MRASEPALRAATRARAAARAATTRPRPVGDQPIIISQIHARWPDARIIVRGDSGSRQLGLIASGAMSLTTAPIQPGARFDDAELAELATVLGREYAIERELGRGGMGVVLLARDLRLDRLVGIKVLPRERAADATH